MFAAEGIGAVVTESETMAEPLDLIFDESEIRKNPNLLRRRRDDRKF